MKIEDIKVGMKVKITREHQSFDPFGNMKELVNNGKDYIVEAINVTPCKGHYEDIRLKGLSWIFVSDSLEPVEIKYKYKYKYKYKSLRNFTTEDLRKEGACDNGIEEFIKHFGFTKKVEINSETIKIMETINDCISFLLRKGFIGKIEEKTYSIGDRFETKWCDNKSREYILATIGENKVILISLKNGYSFCLPKFVKDLGKITEQEMKEITGVWNFTKNEG